MSIESNSPHEQKETAVKINVLLADDLEYVRTPTATMLRILGCTVETVEDGQQLVNRLKNAKPNEFGLVITDREMPNKDGIQALTEVRADERFKHLPVILYSGAIDSNIEQNVKALDGVCLDKPANKEKIKAAIEQALAKFPK